MSKYLAVVAVVLGLCLVAGMANAAPITVSFDAGGDYWSRGIPYPDEPATWGTRSHQTDWINGDGYNNGNPGTTSWTLGAQTVTQVVYDTSGGGGGEGFLGGLFWANGSHDLTGIPSAARDVGGLGVMLDTFFVYSHNGNYNIAINYTTSGLKEGAQYDLEIWSLRSTITDAEGYHSGGPSYEVYSGTTSSPTADLGAVVTATTAAGSVTDETGKTTFSDATLTADDFGNLTFSFYGNSSNIMNGFRLTEVITPEPATMLLFGTGVLGVFGYARRRMMK